MWKGRKSQIYEIIDTEIYKSRFGEILKFGPQDGSDHNNKKDVLWNKFSLHKKFTDVSHQPGVVLYYKNICSDEKQKECLRDTNTQICYGKKFWIEFREGKIYSFVEDGLGFSRGDLYLLVGINESHILQKFSTTSYFFEDYHGFLSRKERMRKTVDKIENGFEIYSILTPSFSRKSRGIILKGPELALLLRESDSIYRK